VTPMLAEQVVKEIATARGLKIGHIVEAFDPRIQGIVDGWATSIDGSRAEKLGMPRPQPLKAIVEQYVQDFV